MLSIAQIKRQYHHGQLPRHWWQGWLCAVIDKPASYLISDDDYVLSDDEHGRFIDGIAKMQQGVPLAYLLGEQDFFGHTFLVNEHTLVPRADTEKLVESVLEWLSEQNLFNHSGRLLDLGTGTGCIALSLAKQLARWQITAVDFSLDALQVAKANAQRLGVENCQFVHSDWFAALTGRFDVIVSNPPYIAKDDVHLNKLTAEPITALVADNQGLSDIMRIVTDAHDFLCVGGLLAIEHGHDQRQAVQAIFLEHGYHQVQTIQDYGANDRLTWGRWHG